MFCGVRRRAWSAWGALAGWHYGWAGGRYKKDTVHVLEVLLFEIGVGTREVEIMRCVCMLQSSEFSVYSSRRADPTDKVKRRLASKPL